MFVWFTYRFADHVVCVSFGVRQDLLRTLRLSPRSVSVVHNPINIDRINSLKNLEPPEGNQFFTTPTFLAVGRLEDQKDYHSLLEAFAIVRGQICSNLVILGEGSLEKEISKKVEELSLSSSVHLLGYRSNPYQYMARCNVLVLSSKWEGLPNVLIEGLAIGVPIVSTDCNSGPKEILDGGRLGHLVPVGDTDLLATAMIEALSRKPGNEEDSFVRLTFSLSGFTNKFLKLINQ